MVEFKEWPKIKRDNGKPQFICITEKMNGTNSCVIIQGGEVVGCQSRKRLLTLDDDNYGFCAWVEKNKEELKLLKDGYHYGEWAGPGICQNKHGLDEKTFFLFDSFGKYQNRPDCCEVVPMLYRGENTPGIVEKVMMNLKNRVKEYQIFQSPLTGEIKVEPIKVYSEGIIKYDYTTKEYTKYTFEFSKGKWREE